jgi:hypothetical protein
MKLNILLIIISVTLNMTTVHTNWIKNKMKEIEKAFLNRKNENITDSKEFVNKIIFQINCN